MLHTQQAACSVLHHFDSDELEEIFCRLEHTIVCEYEDHEVCPVWFCHPMRQVLIHADHCTKRYRTVCMQCKQIIEVIVHHARVCEDVECCIPFCLDIRKTMSVSFPNGVRDSDLEPLVKTIVQEMIYEDDEDEDEDGNKETLNSEDMAHDNSISEMNGEWDGKTPKLFVNLDWEPEDYEEYVREMRRNPPAPRIEEEEEEEEYEVDDGEEEEDDDASQEEEEDMDTCSESSEEPEMMEDWEEEEDI